MYSFLSLTNQLNIMTKNLSQLTRHIVTLIDCSLETFIIRNSLQNLDF